MAAVSLPGMSTARYITPAERQRLLAELPNPRDRLVAIIGFNTGLRISEILSLRWKQLMRGHEPMAYLEVPRRFLKGGRARTKKRVTSRRIPLNAAVAAAIKEWAFARTGSGPLPGERFVFSSRKRYPGVLSRRQAHTIISEAAHRAGLAPGVAPHGLRRSYAGDVYAATGHDLLAVQSLMNHRSCLTTALYLKPRQEELDQVVLSLGAGVVDSDQNHACRISAPCHFLNNSAMRSASPSS